jgi:hypothetical protein
MVIKLRGSKISRKFFYISNNLNVLSTPKLHGTWHNFKHDEPLTYISLIGSLTLPPLLLIFGDSIRNFFGMKDESIHYVDPRFQFDYRHETRTGIDDEGVEYEFVYADGTRVIRK